MLKTLDPGADGVDRASPLLPRRVGQGHLVQAGAMVNINEIHPRSGQFYPHLARNGLGQGSLFGRQHR
ncbi:MAG: hypothetical protein BWY77_01474 [bacterium ADurb.Bin431]|nr:MAG: hypothetical protein BWY77_01474 [bacterium ADurb.Bin431]